MTPRLSAGRWRWLWLSVLACTLSAAAVVPAADAAAGPVSTTFTTCGQEQTFTVPLGVTSVTVHTIGAPGGDGYNGDFGGGPSGGEGADVTGNVSVFGGETLYVNVGCAGASATGNSTKGALYGAGGTHGGTGGNAGPPESGNTSAGDGTVYGAAGGGGGAAGASYASSKVTDVSAPSAVPASTGASVTIIQEDSTQTTVICGPATTAGQPQLCTATVTDTLVSSSTPTGSVDFSSSGDGTFSGGGAPCPLNSSGKCSIRFTPSAFGSGSQTITAAYEGDVPNGFAAGSGNGTLTISPDRYDRVVADPVGDG